MPLKIRQSAKSAVLSFVSSNESSEPDTLGAAMLRMMRIGFEPGLSQRYADGAKAASCISVDFDVTSKERYPWNHDGTLALLSLSEKYGVPLTWAICGKAADEDPRAYDSILRSSVKQEIGVHTYSHNSADSVTREEFEEDIIRCVNTLGLSSPPTSFVFPYNREAHFDVLRGLGFSAFRGAQRVIGAPVKYEGLWNVRPVYYVDTKSLQAEALIRKFVDACTSRSAVFHLWMHPWSLAIDGKVDRMASEVVEPVFRLLREKNERGMMSLATMGSLSLILSNSEGNGGEKGV
jgi:peptidoglycan/xylan/chitin deacetylase (PgdA/CDA1 family)